MYDNIFHFKQFSINDSDCGMKVCTDSVLFGAWINVANAKKILDIGTGSGLISLMLAQKSSATITAIEICGEAANNAAINFLNSPWANRLQIINSSFEDYVKTSFEKYDTIVCNPPWYNCIKPLDSKRKTAKHRETLEYETIVAGVNKLLSNTGIFHVVLPCSESENFRHKALISGLYLNSEILIYTKINNKPKRIFMSFGFERKNIEKEYISIYDKNGQYSDKYKKIIYDFYV